MVVQCSSNNAGTNSPIDKHYLIRMCQYCNTFGEEFVILIKRILLNSDLLNFYFVILLNYIAWIAIRYNTASHSMKKIHQKNFLKVN